MIESQDSIDASLVLTVEEIANLAQDGGKPADTLLNVVALIATRFGTDVCSAYLLEPDRSNLVLAATLGLHPRCIGTLRMPINEGLTGLVAEQVLPVAVDDVRKHSRFKFFSESGEEEYHSFLGVPLVYRGVLQGVLVVQTKEQRIFRDHEIRMLVQAASGIFLIVKEGVKYDVKRCDRGGKLRYFLQRWSGLAMLAFLLPHIVILRGWAHALVGSTLSSAGLPESGGFGYTLLALHPWSSAAANSAMIGLLLAGVLGTVFHIANGAWSGFVLWKVVSTDRGKAWLNLASLAAGIALALVGSIAWYAFSLRPYLHGSLAALLR